MCGVRTGWWPLGAVPRCRASRGGAAQSGRGGTTSPHTGPGHTDPPSTASGSEDTEGQSGGQRSSIPSPGKLVHVQAAGPYALDDAGSC